MASLIVLLAMNLCITPVKAIQINESDLEGLIHSKNNHVLGAEEQATAAEKLTGHLRRSYLPKIEAKIGFEKFKTGNLSDKSEPYGGLEASLNLYNAGFDQLEDEIRNENLLATQSKSSKIRRDEMQKARKAFWTLVSQIELQDLLEEALKENDKNLSSASSRIRAGAASDTDRLEFEMYAIELQQDLERARLAAENSKRDLGTLLGIRDGQFDVPKLVSHDHDDKILSATFQSVDHPEVKMLLSQSHMATFRKSQLRQSWLPKVDVFAQRWLYTYREREYTETSDRWDTVLGVQLTMEIFDGGRNWTESSSASYEALGYNREALQTRAEIESRFESAKAELNLTHQLVHDSETTLKKTARYIVRSMDEYRRGVKNSLDILSVSQRTLSVKKRYIELRRDYQLARAELLAILGE